MWRRRDDWRKELGDKLGVASSCRRLAFRHRQNDSIYVELNRVIEGGTDRLKARTYSLATERREGAWVTRAAGIRDALADLGWQESEGRDEYEFQVRGALFTWGLL